MNEIPCKWIYKGKIYSTKKELQKENWISTTRFNAKVRDKEIIKMITELPPNEIPEITI